VRTARGWTVREAEIVTGMAFSTLAKAERGERTLTGEERVRLVRAFGLSRDEAREIAEFGFAEAVGS